MGSFSHPLKFDGRRLLYSNSSSSAEATNLDNEIGVKILTSSKCESKSEVEPLPRSGHRVVCDDKFLYSFGGYNPSLSQPLFKELWRYNIHTGQWKELPCKNMPGVLASSSVVLSGRLMLVFGGTGAPFGLECSRVLYICDLCKADLSFEIIETTGEAPEPLYGQGIILDKNLLYTVGGTSGFTFSNDIHRLDLKTKVWEKLKVVNPQDCPYPRYRHELALYKGDIYMFGGGVNRAAFSLENIPVFNLERKEWRFIRTSAYNNVHPQPRKSHSLIQVPSEPHIVIICGGNNANGAFGDTWMFDIESQNWQPLPKCSFEFNLHFHDSAVTPSGKMITFGGIKSKRCRRDISEERTKDILVTWVSIPALSDMCFEILLQAFPEVKSYSLENLRNFGLPSKFVKRIVDTENSC